MSRAEFKANLDAAWARLGKPNFVIFQLPQKDANIYSDRKWWADCDQGVANICTTFQKLDRIKENRVDTNFLGNMALKINVKLRGTNHRLQCGSGLFINTMVVGADVTHPGRASADTCPSLAGVVATSDVDCVHYLASARLQINRTEA
ncbi:hypothetical protein ONS95_006642 [Cadophora gregata]|uniref:uncharacterized protein n=1 Tax=Cadophora gregata TaxID=51156 RepID=UPI0026DC53AB|nr:uncharacterized protein ONS95_006642 [Cadophora gregata]KAK0101471.1 hypothetical protein ONS95_006642 [Cadophora gregata]KAK0106521.1 hypothetical protein ONS96_004143 [Cadophora gregata f. sp. sojae]